MISHNEVNTTAHTHNEDRTTPNSENTTTSPRAVFELTDDSDDDAKPTTSKDSTNNVTFDFSLEEDHVLSSPAAANDSTDCKRGKKKKRHIESKLKLFLQQKLGYGKNGSSASSMRSDSSAADMFVNYSSGMFTQGSKVETADKQPSCNGCTEDCKSFYCFFNNKDKIPLHIKSGVGRDEKSHLFQPIHGL